MPDSSGDWARDNTTGAEMFSRLRSIIEETSDYPFARRVFAKVFACPGGIEVGFAAALAQGMITQCD